jgi:hypothetical protein
MCISNCCSSSSSPQVKIKPHDGAVFCAFILELRHGHKQIGQCPLESCLHGVQGMSAIAPVKCAIRLGKPAGTADKPAVTAAKPTLPFRAITVHKRL